MAIFEKDKYVESKVDGVVTLSYDDKNVFNGDTDLTKDTLTKVFKHTSKFITDATDEAVSKATNILKADKEVNKVIVDYPYGPTGSGAVKASITREKTFRIPGKDGATITRPDVQLEVKHTMQSPNESHIKRLQQQMKDVL